MLRRLSLLWKRFSPLEVQLLAAVRAVLPAPAQASFDAQVRAINRVQRLPPDWSEINYYCMRGRKVDWGQVPLFPRTDDFRLAELRFQTQESAYHAVLACVGGHIFDLTVIPGPKAIAFSIRSEPVTAKLLRDPLTAATGRGEPEILPLEWLAVLSDRALSAAAGWTLHTATTAYRVALPAGRYLVLAERGGEEFIVQRLDPPSAMLFHLAGSDARPTPLRDPMTLLVKASD